MLDRILYFIPAVFFLAPLYWASPYLLELLVSEPCSTECLFVGILNLFCVSAGSIFGIGVFRPKIALEIIERLL